MNSCDLSYNYYKTLCWTSVAIPVMYVKYRRNSSSYAKEEQKVENGKSISGLDLSQIGTI